VQTFIVEERENGVFDRPASIYEITFASASVGGRKWFPLTLLSSERLDVIRPEWRHAHGEPKWLIQYDNSMCLVPRQIFEEVKVRLEGFRLPHPIMETGEPEINPAHHERLLDWAFARAFRVHDADGFDPDAAERHEAAFNSYSACPWTRIYAARRGRMSCITMRRSGLSCIDAYRRQYPCMFSRRF
jgi:hypothetical protein